MNNRITTPILFDHRGQPIEARPTNGNGNARTHPIAGTVAKAYSSYVSSVFGLDASPISRAQEPFDNHAWVYAAAMAMAINLCQAPFTIFRETEDTLLKRKTATQKAGRAWLGAPSGRRRTAIDRHATRQGNPSRYFGARLLGLEPDPSHELSLTLQRANPYMTKSQLFQATVLWMVTRGQSFWYHVDAQGAGIAPGAFPTEIYPLNPDLVTPIISSNRLVGWLYTIAKGAGFGRDGEKRIIEPHQVTRFYFVDPRNPSNAVSPLTAAAGGITLDLMSQAHNKAVIENGAEPGGVLTHKEAYSPEEVKKLLSDFNERHKGPARAKSLGYLTGGWQYIPTAMSPADMEYLEQRRWGREEILAVLRVPKSILSVTDDLNYATQLGQDWNFWDKNLIPLARYIEDAIDGSLLFDRPDNEVGLFDFSNVEALRQGMAERIKQAMDLASNNLHVPPRVAFKMVGIDAPEYVADDTVLVNPITSIPLAQVLSGDIMPTTVQPGGDVLDPIDDPAGGKPLEQQPGKSLRKVADPGKRWRNLIATAQEPAEKLWKSVWRGWISVERAQTLKRFDEATRAVRAASLKDKTNLPLDAILGDVRDMQKRLRKNVRPVYMQQLEAIYQVTVAELGGVAVFELDSPSIVAALERRQAFIVGKSPVSLQDSMRRSLRIGIEGGEPIAELRQRVAHVFDIAESSSKTLQVARTESSGFMNSARDAMFEETGFTKEAWITAADEHVRETHAVFGAAKPQARGFNYLSLVGGKDAGTLKYPGDMDCKDASEVVNCRCVKVPVE